jgi:soluble lytic murein transglycosylase
LQQIYSTENPDLLDLIGRVKAQEHGVDAHGNFLTSPAGAIGPMQVMPDTAPEAAALAGVPWDEHAYRTDAAYNELIGIAYLSEQLRKYDGDVTRALAAYNAGPNRTDHALEKHGEKWLASMPAETREYVARIGT